jgi:hypothetical protein
MTDWKSYQDGSAALDAETAQNWLNQVAATCSTLDPDLILDIFTDDVCDLAYAYPPLTSGLKARICVSCPAHQRGTFPLEK